MDGKDEMSYIWEIRAKVHRVSRDVLSQQGQADNEKEEDKDDEDEDKD